ncbi:MAG: polysaccharide deacetylase family protein [Lachnospiraceae bacterium]|nr:polysaccharide deacetylase family protein [Lachnospiraceae bacterium]
MKKQRIMEAVYTVVALVFLGLCIEEKNRSEQNRPVLGTEVTKNGEGAPIASDKADTITPVQKADESAVTPEPGRTAGAVKISNENYEQYSNEAKAWWFLRKENHKPSGSGEEFPIAPYDAYYLNKSVGEKDKVIYLTFDCGYENGFTPAILDTLAEKNVKAMFFVTRDFIVRNPAYVKRMKEEGHLVGNHTVRHLSSPSLTPEELEEELREVEKTMEEQTGYRMDPFFRPPMGEYSERTLKVTQDMGYASIFWSIAYYDYNVDEQPGKDYVTEHFAKYHHNGAIALLHNISESNRQALPEVIELLRAEGYRFGTLTELTEVNE